MNNNNLQQSKAQAGGSRGASIFACSLTLLVENFKMYWYIPLLSFVAYFFGGIFPIIANHDDLDNYCGFITNSFANYNAAYLPLLVFVPLIASVTVMSFYHKQDRAIALHSQPLSKSRIFNSQILSGWLMCELPLILTALLYLCFMKECYMHAVSDYYSSSADVTDPAMQNVNVYTVFNIAAWLGSTTAMMTFFYGLYTLAGALVGTGIMQVLLSGVFFGVVPMILFIAHTYCDEFLCGYGGMSDTAENLMLSANPALRVFACFGDMLSAKFCLLYLLVGLAALVLARTAYAKAKLEKVGDSMIFKSVEEFITWLISFVGAASCGLLFYLLAGGTLPILILGMLVGLLVTYFVVKIIIAKSIKVFNKRNLISLGIAALICLLFLAVTVFDITGYHKRIPAEDQIEGVYVVDLSTSNLYTYYSMPNELRTANYLVTDPAVIEKVRALHEICAALGKSDMEISQMQARGIVKPEDFPDGKIPELYHYSLDGAGNLNPEAARGVTCTFSYKLKNGTTFNRSFPCYLTDEAAEIITELQSMPAYQAAFTIGDKLKELDITSISADVQNFYSENSEKYEEDTTVGQEYDAAALDLPDTMPADIEPYADNITFSDKEADKIYGMIDAMDRDICERDFYDDFRRYTVYNDNYELAYVSVTFSTAEPLSETYTDPNSGSFSGVSVLRTDSRDKVRYNYSIGFSILQSDTHTLAYLKDLGYSIVYGK